MQRLRCPVLFSMWEGRSGAACLGTRRRMLGCTPAAGVRKGKIRRPPSARRGKIWRLNVKILLPETEPQGFAEKGEQREEAPGARRGKIRRRECEDFAPRNGGIRVSGEGGAKSEGRRACGGAKSAGGNVKILLPGTEP